MLAQAAVGYLATCVAPTRQTVSVVLLLLLTMGRLCACLLCPCTLQHLGMFQSPGGYLARTPCNQDEKKPADLDDAFLGVGQVHGIGSDHAVGLECLPSGDCKQPPRPCFADMAVIMGRLTQQ
jgi:hypothetical protein